MSGLVKVNPVKSENIPDFLKSLPHWVVWKSFNTRDDGRFDKIPIHPISGHKINFKIKKIKWIIILPLTHISRETEMVLE